MTASTAVHLELYSRTHCPKPIAARLDDRRSALERLADQRSWTVGVTRWPTKIELTDDGQTSSVAEHVHEVFDRWATETGVSLDPAFERRDCYSWTSGDPCEALVLPVACLAIRRNGDLEGVYPHRDDEEVRTITDGIDALRAGEVLTDDHERSPELVP